MYEISVKGRVGEGLLADVEGLQAQQQSAMTLLRSDVDSAAALRDLLDRLCDRGLELVQVRRIEPDG